MIDALVHDLRSAVRSARRRPAFAAAVAATLAVAIAGATTAYGLAASVLWRDLPFDDAARLAFVWEEVDADGEPQPSRVTGARYHAWRAASPFSSLALFGAAGFTLDTPGGAVPVRGVRVSTGYFDTLGIRPAIGRAFDAGDGAPGRDRVVIVSHAFWQTRLGGGDAIGRDLRLSGEPYTIVGVMPAVVFPAWPVNPAAVTLDAESRELWVPIADTAALAHSDRSHVFGVVARLTPGTTAAQAALALSRVTDPSAPDAHRARVTPLRDQLVRDARTPLLALLGATLAVLLIACANLAALYASGFEARRAELLVRAAVGASVGRLARHLLCETLLVTFAGSVGGLALARVALTELPRLLPASLPFLTAAVLDAGVAAFALALAALATVALTAWPIASLASAAPAPRGVTRPPRRTMYGTLVVAQVALAVALVAVAGLLAQSLGAVRGVEPGFHLEDVLVLDLGLPSGAPRDPRRVAAAEAELLARVAALPRVRAVAAAYDHPLEANWSEAPAIEGDVARPAERRAAELRIVSAGYFEALGVTLLDGRLLEARDDLDRPGAVVINEALARELGGRVLGRRLETGTPRFLFGDAVPRAFEIVGVVGNERFRGPEQPAQPAFYLATRQFPQTDLSLLVRTAGDPLDAAADVGGAIRAVDRAITMARPTTLERILAEQLAARRVTTDAIGGLAGAALALAALGLYGLLAILVAARRRDIGVRLALGASPGLVARGVLREGLAYTGAGIALGAVAALAAGRWIEGLLVGVSGRDPLTLGVVAATLLAVALAAAALPARRAARIDPIDALRAG